MSVNWSRRKSTLNRWASSRTSFFPASPRSEGNPGDWDVRARRNGLLSSGHSVLAESGVGSRESGVYGLESGGESEPGRELTRGSSRAPTPDSRLLTPRLPFTVHRLRFSFHDLSNFGHLSHLRHPGSGQLLQRVRCKPGPASLCPLPGRALAPGALLPSLRSAGAARARDDQCRKSDRQAWLVAGTVCVLLVAGIVYKVSSDASGPVAPDMANAGSSGGAVATAGPSGPAPDISAMTPRERFDRLYNRIMQASERSDSAEVERFTPMALGAYQQLDTRDADARYHAAVLQMQVGNFPAARALADTIVQESPGPPVRLRHPGHRGPVAERSCCPRPGSARLPFPLRGGDAAEASGVPGAPARGGSAKG